MKDELEFKTKIKEICDLKEKLISDIKESYSNGCYEGNIEIAGEIVDMIKDYCEIEKNAWESKYYETLIDAMGKSESESMSDDERFGYNYNRRSNGEYARRGTGDMTMGYPYYRMPNYSVSDLMGYSNNGNSGRSYSNSNNSSYSNNGNSGYSNNGNSGGSNSNSRYGYGQLDDYFDPKYGESYNRYRIARRHYHDSNSDSDKEEMNDYAKDSVNDAMNSMKEIYRNSSPEMKKRVKEDLTKMINDLPTT